MLKKYVVIFLCHFFMLGVVFSATSDDTAIPDIYQFTSSQQSQQFNKILQELRCLVCQNESLADSNAPLAVDLRQQVYTMLLDEKPEDEIKNYLVSRYGDFVLYRPPMQANTLALWIGPLLLLIVGVLVWLWAVLRKSRGCSA
jgi:cytochrome c-type biogenesis protein CcmH